MQITETHTHSHRPTEQLRVDYRPRMCVCWCCSHLGADWHRVRAGGANEQSRHAARGWTCQSLILLPSVHVDHGREENGETLRGEPGIGFKLNGSLARRWNRKKNMKILRAFSFPQVPSGKVKVWYFKDKPVVFKEGAATPGTWAPEGTLEFLCGDTQLKH